MYSVRFPSASSIDSTAVYVGRAVHYAPTQSTYVLTRQLRKEKGSDASNMWDEEVGDDEREYSDDEEEAAAKRKAKNSKCVSPTFQRLCIFVKVTHRVSRFFALKQEIGTRRLRCSVVNAERGTFRSATTAAIRFGRTYGTRLGGRRLGWTRTSYAIRRRRAEGRRDRVGWWFDLQRYCAGIGRRVIGTRRWSGRCGQFSWEGTRTRSRPWTRWRARIRTRSRARKLRTARTRSRWCWCWWCCTS